MFSRTCTASSRVGTSTSARGTGGPVISAGRFAMIFSSIGQTKAAVLPVPVWAVPTMSRPFMAMGTARIWIGVGSR